jgi:hypothetical protein
MLTFVLEYYGNPPHEPHQVYFSVYVFNVYVFNVIVFYVYFLSRLRFQRVCFEYFTL